MQLTTAEIKARLEYLRGEIEAERISYGEIAELQDLAAHIEPGDVLLLQWAGVPEFPPVEEEECPNCSNGTIGLENGRLVCRGECGRDFGAKPVDIAKLIC